MGFIYKITNEINRKVYVSKTIKTLEQRFNEHKQKARIHTNRYLYDAMNHYGYENFHIEKIEECNDDLLNEREKFWISELNTFMPNGYNMTVGGDGGDTWSKNRNKEITSIKISNALKGKKKSKKFCEYMSSIEKGVYQIDIDKDSLLKDIRCGMHVEDICDFYKISRKQLGVRVKDYYGCTIRDLRNDNFTRNKRVFSEDGKARFVKAHSERISGKNNINYKEVDKKELLNLILSGEKVIDIAKQFNVTKQTIFNKCKEYFGTKKTREVKEIYEKQ